MSAKPSPEEPNTPFETAAEGEKPEAAAPEDNQPQAGENANASTTTGEPAAEDAEQPAEAGAGQAAAAEARVKELETQIADVTDRLLRAHAEIDNIRKRAERDKADMARYAITRFAGDIVVLADNFQRALSTVQIAGDEPNPSLKGLVEGVIMMEREFLNVLERHGVKRIDPQGQPFNPHLHEAVMEQQNPEVPNATVVQVFQPGYTIEDRVLRPAMVVVAKGGPKPQPATERPAESQAQEEASEPQRQQQQQANTEGNEESKPSDAGERNPSSGA